MHEGLAEKWAHFVFDVPLRSKVNKLFGCPQNDVMSLCTKFGYDMLKRCWEQAYLLFGGFAVKFGWLSRPNGFELENSVSHICSAWSEDHIGQVSWWLDLICGRWICNVDMTTFNMAARLCRQVWLAVTAKWFWIRKRCLPGLFGLFWRSYRASFMMIGHSLWPVDM